MSKKRYHFSAYVGLHNARAKDLTHIRNCFQFLANSKWQFAKCYFNHLTSIDIDCLDTVMLFEIDGADSVQKLREIERSIKDIAACALSDIVTFVFCRYSLQKNSM